MTDLPLLIASFQNLHDNVPKSAMVTWEELTRRLTRHRERTERDGELWSPTFYAPGCQQCLQDNVIQLSCFVIDCDDGTPPETYEALWEPYAYLVHSTQRHTAAAPRWHAVFPLAPYVWASEWERVWSLLTEALAPGNIADPQCKNADRRYFTPVYKPGDEDRFIKVHDGRRLNYHDFAPTPAAVPARMPKPLKLSLPPSPPRAAGERVPVARLMERALQTIVLEKHPDLGQGRHAGTKWLFCQLRDNGYSHEEAQQIGDEWFAVLPDVDTAGDPAEFPHEELTSLWAWAYSQPARQPWTPPEPIPDPPEELAPPERRTSPPLAVEGDAAPPGAEVMVPPPSGLPGSLAPRLKPETPAGAEAVPAFDFRSVYNLTWLQAAAVAPPQWIVEDLIPEGLTELYGHAKLGKSFVALGIGVPVALGGIALSQFACRAGEVLYLAAEDAMWRMKERSAHLLTDVPAWPEGFFIDHEFGFRMDKNGRRKVEAWIQARPETRLIILDPWHAFRIPYPKGADIAMLDYDVARALNLLGAKYHCGIVVVHHSSKAGNNDDDVNGGSGSHGLAAGAGAVIRFQRAREENQAKMSVRGRDIRKEITWQLNRDDRTGFWNVEGDAAVTTINVTRQAIYHALLASGPMKPKALAEHTGVPLPTIQWTCRRMAEDGEVANNAGTYMALRMPGAITKDKS